MRIISFYLWRAIYFLESLHLFMDTIGQERENLELIPMDYILIGNMVIME